MWFVLVTSVSHSPLDLLADAVVDFRFSFADAFIATDDCALLSVLSFDASFGMREVAVLSAVLQET